MRSYLWHTKYSIYRGERHTITRTATQLWARHLQTWYGPQDMPPTSYSSTFPAICSAVSSLNLKCYKSAIVFFCCLHCVLHGYINRRVNKLDIPLTQLLTIPKVVHKVATGGCAHGMRHTLDSVREISKVKWRSSLRRKYSQWLSDWPFKLQIVGELLFNFRLECRISASDYD